MLIEDKDKINPNEKIELKSNPNCKYCLEKGYIRVIPQGLDASRYKELRPCSCVKAIVELKLLNPEKEAEQKVIR